MSQEFSTGEMIQLLKAGGVAQLVRWPEPTANGGAEVRENYLRAFDNAYCVKKHDNGAIRWHKGCQGLLGMSRFVVGEARWKIAEDRRAQ